MVLQQIGTIVFKNVSNVFDYAPTFHFFLRVFFGFIMATITFITGIVHLGFKRMFLTRVNRSKFRPPEFLNDLGTHSTFTTREGIKIHMVIKGDPKKPTILFLHGFPDCWVSWKNQIPFFAQKGYRCVALSIRGYVDSTKSGDVGDFVLPKLIDDVKETITFLGVQSVILVGHDWGGAIATSFADAYPEMVKKLVVLNFGIKPIFSDLIRFNPKQFFRSWYIYFFQIPFLPELNMKLGDFVPLELVYRKELKTNLMSEDELNLRKFYCSQPGSLTSMINYYRGIFYDPNVWLKTSFQIKVPSKFIWGEKDPYLVVENLDGLDRYIDDVTVVRIPDIGHFVHLEAPDQVNKEISKFID